MGRARDPGWGKRSTGAVGRHGYGVKKNQKPVKQAWMLGEQAKQALRAAPRRAPARAANEQAAERAQPSPEAPPLPASSRKPATAKSMDASKVAGRKRKRQWRDETGGIAKAPRGDKNAKARKERAATVAAIPKDIGASAANCNLVYAPGRAGARVYTPSNPPIDVKVPVEHLLHASFKMEPITRTARPTGQLKFALENGGVVLSEHDHLQSMDALAWN